MSRKVVIVRLAEGSEDAIELKDHAVLPVRTSATDKAMVVLQKHHRLRTRKKSASRRGKTTYSLKESRNFVGQVRILGGRRAASLFRLARWVKCSESTLVSFRRRLPASSEHRPSMVFREVGVAAPSNVKFALSASETRCAGTRGMTFASTGPPVAQRPDRKKPFFAVGVPAPGHGIIVMK